MGDLWATYGIDGEMAGRKKGIVRVRKEYGKGIGRVRERYGKGILPVTAGC